MRQRHCGSAGTATPVNKRLVQSLEDWRSETQEITSTANNCLERTKRCQGLVIGLT